MREDIITTVRADCLPLNVVLCGTSYCDGSYYIRREQDNETFVAEYVIAGSGVVKCGNKTVYPKAGDMYILMPGEVHEYYTDRENPWTKIWFNAEGELAEQLAGAYRLGRRVIIEECDGSEYIRKIHEICRDSSLTPYVQQSKCAVVFLEMMQFLARESTPPKEDDAARIREYIERNAAAEIAVYELAALISRSVSQTIRLFKSAYGVTPYEYLLRQKIDRAKLMLKGTNMRIKEISQALSFSDEHYFSGVFRKKVGMSPTEYRRG